MLECIGIVKQNVQFGLIFSHGAWYFGVYPVEKEYTNVTYQQLDRGFRIAAYKVHSSNMHLNLPQMGVAWM
jgi:hypothetical protein